MQYHMKSELDCINHVHCEKTNGKTYVYCFGDFELLHAVNELSQLFLLAVKIFELFSCAQLFVSNFLERHFLALFRQARRRVPVLNARWQNLENPPKNTKMTAAKLLVYNTHHNNQSQRGAKTYVVASFNPQSSLQYLEFTRAGSTQPGP